MKHLKKMLLSNLPNYLALVLCIMAITKSLWAGNSNPEIVIHFRNVELLYDDTAIDTYSSSSLIVSFPENIPKTWKDANVIDIWQIAIKPGGTVIVTLLQSTEWSAPFLASYEFPSLNAYNAEVRTVKSLKISPSLLNELRNRAKRRIYLYNAADMNSDEKRFALSRNSPVFKLLEAKLLKEFNGVVIDRNDINNSRRKKQNALLAEDPWTLDSIQLGEIWKSQNSEKIYTEWIGIFKPLNTKGGGPKSEAEAITHTFSSFTALTSNLIHSENLTLFTADFEQPLVQYLYAGRGKFEVIGLMPDFFAKDRRCPIPFSHRRTGPIAKID